MGSDVFVLNKTHDLWNSLWQNSQIRTGVSIATQEGEYSAVNWTGTILQRRPRIVGRQVGDLKDDSDERRVSIVTEVSNNQIDKELLNCL